MGFYNFEDWAANNLQNQAISRKSPLGHWGGADQEGYDGQVSDYQDDERLREHK